ncbi:hypothetical protein FE257_010971 [Aspergillus nanangensis]|uniref:Uncharacterized protein n=1 Tax=Aspergillus nanangensis TaxID=2582783 RepID=A0AAD4CJC9_ASPNN|nr:hypothetical protein FE257_010971 [Aspergillus nanangensis]
MFEDFSFSSPSSARPARLALDPDDRLMVDSDSALISPLSSRCPSPRSSSSHRFPRSLPRSRSSYFRSPPPTSVPSSAYDHKRLSIGTLTRKLHEHTIQNNHREPISPTTNTTLPGYFLTPPDTDLDDEGFFDSPPSLLTSPSLSPQQPQSPFLTPTSVPSDLFFHGNSSVEDHHYQQQTLPNVNVRAQRQNIARLQCNPSDVDAMRRALLSDDDALKFKNPFRDAEVDCHPSSLPPQVSPRRRAATLNHRGRYRPQTGSGLVDSGVSDSISLQQSSRGRRKSSAGQALHACSSTSRIEKNYHHHPHHHASARDLRKKSEQGLRRKSLVSAALASMVENDV